MKWSPHTERLIWHKQKLNLKLQRIGVINAVSYHTTRQITLGDTHTYVRIAKRHTQIAERHTQIAKRHTQVAKRHTQIAKRHTQIAKRHTYYGTEEAHNAVVAKVTAWFRACATWLLQN